MSRKAGAPPDEVAAHYASLLAPVYGWSVGGAPAALARGEQEIEALGLPPAPGARVVDLGAGFGAHAIPLALRGARVLAIDTSATLLAELSALAGPQLTVKTVVANLLDFHRHLQEPAAAIVCLGDTLPHLETLDAVLQLVRRAAVALPLAARLVLSFRDYSREPVGTERVIPVRADETRALTCRLRFGPLHVEVHDTLHQRTPCGWTTSASSYRKLRLAPESVLALLDAAGFEARRVPGAAGMETLLATRR